MGIKEVAGRIILPGRVAASFPLLAAELARHGRQERLAKFRVAYAVGVCMLFGFPLWSATWVRVGVRRQSLVDPDSVTRALSATADYMNWLQALPILAAVLVAAVAIAREREDHTLPTLLLAGFSTADLYLGKFLGILVLSGELLLVPLPFYALLFRWETSSLPAAIGGLWLSCVSLVFVCALGLYVSSFCRRAGTAILLMLGLMVMWIASVPLLMDATLSLTLPMVFNSLAAMWNGLSDDLGVVAGATVTHLTAAAVLAWLTIRRLPKLIYEESRPARRKVKRTRRQGMMKRPPLMSPAVHFVYVSTLGLASALRRYRLGLVFAAAFGVGAAFQPILVVVAALLLAFDVASSAQAATRNGMLLDMLLMPQDDRQAGRALLTAYTRHAWIYVPALVVTLDWVLPSLGASSNRFLLVARGQEIAATVQLLGDLGIWAMGLALVFVMVVFGVLGAANMAFQGASLLYATFTGAATILLIGGEALMLGNVLFRVRPGGRASQFVIALVALTALALLALYYYRRRYLRGLRAALFEEQRVKKKFW